MSFTMLGISGSLRAASTNTALLRACQGLMPEGAELVLLEYGDLPLYNGDLETEGPPPAVARVRQAIRDADALLFATPEYNHSISGVLKNLIDWASRPAFQSSLVGTPSGMLSAAPGAVGGARAQQHLKPILLSGMVPIFPGPEVVVNHVGDKLEGDVVTHEATAAFLTKYLADFVAWTKVQPTP